MTALLAIQVVNTRANKQHKVLYLFHYISGTSLDAERYTAVVHSNVSHESLGRPHDTIARAYMLENRSRG